MEEVQLERDVLGVIAEQKAPHKEHLMDLIAFYTFGDEINLVFPYVEKSLEMILCSDWTPNVALSEDFPNNWISRGLLGLAEGLKIIHKPPTQPQLSEKGTIIGFHFDLKPANILVTADGTFKITDFGQALIKLVNIGESSSEGVPHLGGDPRYAPPEGMPTREAVSRSSQPYKYMHEHTPAPQPPTLAVAGAPTNARASSPARLDIPNSNCGSRISLCSVPQQALGSAKYDIWSLACVMLETLIHTCHGGQEAVEAFRADRRRSGTYAAFHTSQGINSELQNCVQDRLSALETGQSSTSPWTSSMQIYMHDVVSSLRRMLSVAEEDRLEAPEVVGRLEGALWRFKLAKRDKNGLVQIMREQTSHMARSSFYELAHDEVGTSFLDIDDIQIQDFKNGPDLHECRIRVYAKRAGRGDGKPDIVIFIAFKMGESSVKVQEIPCYMSEATQYSPLYLNTSTDASWTDKCRLKTENFDKKIWFDRKPAELLSLQAVLFQHAVEPSRSTPHPSSTDVPWNLYRSISPPLKVVLTLDDYKEIELRPLAVQIWTSKSHTAALRFPSQATSRSTTSSGVATSRTRLVLFLDPQKIEKTGKCYHVLHVPLEPRLGSINEGGVPGDTENTPTTLFFKATDSHATYGGFTVFLAEARGKSPVLSLDPKIYRRDIDPPEERRSRGLKMIFHQPSGMFEVFFCECAFFSRANIDRAAKQAIETIRRHFDTANESNNPKIAWKERPATRPRQR
jgi:serine/threonine protein kinase